MHQRRLRVQDAAEYCGLSVSTLNKYRLTGEGPVFIKLGRAVMYEVDDLETWITANKYSSTSEFSEADMKREGTRE